MSPYFSFFFHASFTCECGIPAYHQCPTGNLGKGTCTSFRGHFSYAWLKQTSVKSFCCKCYKQWDLPINGLSTGDQLKQVSLKIPDHINGKHNSVFSSFLEEEEHLLQGWCDVWKLWQKVHLGGRAGGKEDFPGAEEIWPVGTCSKKRATRTVTRSLCCHSMVSCINLGRESWEMFNNACLQLIASLLLLITNKLKIHFFYNKKTS